MKLSIEAKVAAAVAIAFATLSIGAIAQEQSEHGTAGLSQMSLRGSDSHCPRKPKRARTNFSPNTERDSAAVCTRILGRNEDAGVSPAFPQA